MDGQLQTKTMVQASGEVGRTVPVDRDAHTPIEDDYHTIQGTKSESFETYSNRMSALVDALGNKDSVKG